MAAPKFWEADPVADTAPANGGPRPIYTAPDPQGDAKERRDEAAAARDEGRFGIDQSSEARQSTSAAIQNAANLRSAYDGQEAVKAYSNSLPSLMAALQTQENSTGDSALVYAYAKAMDPSGAVQQGDVELASSGASTIGSTVARFNKEFGLEGGGTLPPEIRKRLKDQIVLTVSQRARAYELQRQRFAEDARRFGLDPASVIGPNVADAFREEYARLTKPAAAPTNASTYADGVRFGMDGGPDGSFDASQYLSETYGLTPDKQDRIVGMWRANLGNANLTVEAAKQWYAQEGVPPPSDQELTQTIEQTKASQPGTPVGFDTSAAQADYQAKLDAVLAQRGADPESLTGTIGVNAGQGILLGGADEIAGLGGFAGALARGDNPVAAYQGERDLIRREQERSQAANPVTSFASELGGGLLTIPLGFGGARTAADVTKAGAVVGGASGFLYGQGAQDSLGKAALGAGTGAALSYGGSKAGDYLTSRAAGRSAQGLAEGGEVIQAADNLNARFGTDIQPIPADVSGPGIRNLTAGVVKMPLSAAPIIKGGQAVTDEAEKARNAIAALAGGVISGEAAGEAALNGAQKYIKSSKTKVDALYAKARQLGGDEVVNLSSANTALRRNIMELADTPSAEPALEYLRNLSNQLDRGDWTVEGVKRMRTQLRDKFISDGLRSSDLERRVNQVIDAADDDIADSLVAAGKTEAASAYQAASKAHAERVAVIDEVLTPIIGKNGDKSVEDVMKALDTAAKTKGARLGKFLSSLPPSDAGAIRATMISRLGRVTAGRQDAAGTIFSLNDFLTHWNQISDSAKSQLFGGELRAALTDLAKVAQGTKGAQQYGNFSNTGTPLGLVGTTSVGSIGMVTHPFVATGALIGQYASGKLLASPAFARWLAKMPSNSSLAAKHVSGLSKVAAADSVIAADALGLQQQLSQAFQGPGRAAANEQTSKTEEARR